jgi:hypothetical protein
MRFELLIETPKEFRGFAARACPGFGFARELDEVSAKPRKKFLAHD